MRSSSRSIGMKKSTVAPALGLGFGLRLGFGLGLELGSGLALGLGLGLKLGLGSSGAGQRSFRACVAQAEVAEDGVITREHHFIGW